MNFNIIVNGKSNEKAAETVAAEVRKFVNAIVRWETLV